ncbi:hypothetical protein [Streptomyces sp. VRA16 Mangrove soil]|uniref:hypothetical protein n=1 Tax=Streptomyces sp. VRA16 Mangrove soil TaxID=2817434 RepID=UPI001A9DC081|nr:hypothetical protein [Streptomyces sp. VRA16 Mangrove soil]MBO1333789.1 hypothetical protein [Streptomyces sp. VRA16 Mangrove soil]
MAARRFAALSDAELTAREERQKVARTRKTAAIQVKADQDARRTLPCVVCGTPLERKSAAGSKSGRISKYCGEACRHRRKRELSSVAPGAVSQFLRYASPAPGAHANAEEFYGAYVVWAGAYGIEPLSPSDMLPQLKAAGFRIEGAGAHQVVVFRGISE